MAKETRRRALPWRRWLRAVHRDAGYFCVGLTVIYAVSGLAVNHIGDWEPNFRQIQREHQLAPPIPLGEEQLVKAALAASGVPGPVREVFREAGDKLTIELDSRSLLVDLRTGRIAEEGQEPRFFLRAANWLHLNRGKKAWTLVADAYAIGLLCLAASGLLMFPGRRGLFGRAGLIALSGALVPALYVLLSGSP